MTGNAASPKLLAEAGIVSADLLVAVTDEDEVNLLACLVGGALAPGCTLVARVRDRDFHAHRDLLEKGGLRVDGWISPRQATAKELADLALLPGAVQVKEFIGGALRMVAAQLCKTSALVGKSLAQLRSSGAFAKLTVVGVERDGYFVPPKGNTELRAGDLLFAVGSREAADTLPKLCGQNQRRVKSVMVAGGGRVGIHLSRLLLDAGLNVRLAEGNLARCHGIAEELPKADVLNGDCTDQDFLIDERISHCDVFIACTQDDEVNILTALLAKKLGAKAVLTRENTAHYSSLTASIGVDAAVSVRQAAVGSILRYARRGDVLAAQPFGNTEGEALEVRARETSALVSSPIRELHLPKDVVIGAVFRGETLLVATGELTILPGDKVVIFAPQRRIADVQKLVSVGLHFI
jgi:trk system potassium uptake protein TrkA